MNITRKWRLPAMLVSGLIAASAALSPVQAAGSSPAIPAAVASKLESSPKLSKLWADPSARTAVVVRFDMPAFAPASSFSSTAAAAAAQTSAIHAVQDKILGAAFGSVLAGTAAESRVLKRMDYSPMFGIYATAAEIEAFAANPLVTLIQADRVSKPMLDTALPQIGMPTAYTQGATGAGWAVAVLDTGARRTHKFLAAHIVAAACYSTANPETNTVSLCPNGTNGPGLNTAGGCPVSVTGCDHGTHVSGDAAGLNANRLAGEPANGAARNGQIISINVFTRTGANLGSSGTDQILALEHVLTLHNNKTFKIAAANMSLGSDEGFAAACDDDPLKPIIDQLRTAGIATVIAAGNESRNGAVGSPGCITSAITVGAVNAQDVRADFSNWSTQVDLAAPGVDIISSTTVSDSSFGPSSGTSMASPIVAGAFAAIRTIRPTATVTQIENALKSTGLKVTAVGVTTPRIRVPQAIAAIPAGGGTATLAAAVTPVARATAINGTVTAFATILNSSTTAGTSCSIALPTGTQNVTFSYAGNAAAKTPSATNTPVTIPANGAFHFVLSFKPTVAMSTNLALVFKCANSAAAPSTVGLNTFLLTAIAGTPADVVSVAVTATKDGIVNVPLGKTGAVALAAVNIGTAANLQARLSANAIGVTGKTLPAGLFICQTKTDGTCLKPPAATVNFSLANKQTATFTALIASNGTAIPFNPANTRLFVHFFQGTNPVGSASVAVRTVPAPAPVLAAAN